MGEKPEKLLARAIASTAQWKRKDIDKLYKAYGFIIINGGKHDIVKHPDYPFLRATLPRHVSVHKVYVETAVTLINEYLKSEESKK
ncbi:MAG: hypothetical protein C0401_03750 [Anaerolinea sp.]|nr:hypothetical protein [Anaerolinea sp.]